VFEIVKITGTKTERIPGTPLFETKAEAVAYASQYFRGHPDEFRKGREGCSARRRQE
jgi:hypothetical protein